MSAKMIQLTQNGVMKYPRTIDQAIAVVAKAKLLSTVLAELEAEDVRLAGLIAEAEGKITILNGSGEGSVDKKIADAIDEFATQVTDNGTIDTVKELMDYVAEHAGDFSALLSRVSTAEGDIDTLEGKVSALEGDNTTNKQNIAANTEAISGLNTKVGSSVDEANAEGSLYARLAQVKADLAALSGEGGTVAEQIGSAIDKFNEETIAPIASDVEGLKTSKVDQSVYDAKMEAVDGSIAANAEAAATAAGAAATADGKAVTAQNRADAAYTLAEGKIGYTIVGDATYPDFAELISNEA